MSGKVLTSILLERVEFDLLDKVAERTGKSKSCLIREALAQFLPAT